MEINQSNNIPKKENVIIFSISIIVFLLLWAGLTKAGYIPNFLKLPYIDPCPFYKTMEDYLCHPCTSHECPN